MVSVTISKINTQLAIFPNPTTGYINLQNLNDISTITIFDMMGKVVLQTPTNDNLQMDLNLSAQPAGVYILKTDTGETQKIVKQ